MTKTCFSKEAELKSNYSVLKGLDNLNLKSKSGVAGVKFGNKAGNFNTNKEVTKPKVNVDLKRKRFS